jgi:hypothetical protein
MHNDNLAELQEKRQGAASMQVDVAVAGTTA